MKTIKGYEQFLTEKYDSDIVNEGMSQVNDNIIDLLSDQKTYTTEEGNEPGVFIIKDLSIKTGDSKVGVWYNKESRQGKQFKSNLVETDDTKLSQAIKPYYA